MTLIPILCLMKLCIILKICPVGTRLWPREELFRWVNVINWISSSLQIYTSNFSYSYFHSILVVPSLYVQCVTYPVCAIFFTIVFKLVFFPLWECYKGNLLFFIGSVWTTTQTWCTSWQRRGRAGWSPRGTLLMSAIGRRLATQWCVQTSRWFTVMSRHRRTSSGLLLELCQLFLCIKLISNMWRLR